MKVSLQEELCKFYQCHLEQIRQGGEEHLTTYHPAAAYHLDQVREKENDDGKGAAIWIRTKKKRRSGVKHNS